VSTLSDGTLTFTATMAGTAGGTAQTTSTAVKDTAEPELLISDATDPVNAANANAVEISGAGEAGDTITLVVSDGTSATTTYTTAVASDGTWNIAGIDVHELADGEISYTIVATDAGGNTVNSSLSASKDTVAPAVVIASVTDSIDANTASNVSLAGSGEAGATISVVISDSGGATLTFNNIIDGGGVWSWSGIDVSSLADGTLIFTVTATDGAGNSTNASTTATKSSDASNLVDLAFASEDDWL
jgi:hypothetical protein